MRRYGPRGGMYSWYCTVTERTSVHRVQVVQIRHSKVPDNSGADPSCSSAPVLVALLTAERSALLGIRRSVMGN